MGNALMSRATSQAQLVEYLYRIHVFRDERVRAVLLAVDRADYAPRFPYFDSPQYIGYGATISAPHMHALALKHLVDYIPPGSHVLDVGSGSGYLAVCFAKLAGKSGKVVGIDHVEELVEASRENVRKNNAALLDTGQLELVVGDGREGWRQHAPYQAIHVGAAAPEVPQALIDQLAKGGRMLIPVGRHSQQFTAIDRLQDGTIRRRHLADVMFVPLTNKSRQLGEESTTELFTFV